MAAGGQSDGSMARTIAVGTAVLLVLAIALIAGPSALRADPAPGGSFQGVASCAGTTCHGRMEADGAVVRQDELMRWQEASTPGGAHSRAFTVLSYARARQITATLAMGDPTSAPACLGCHRT